MYYIKPRPGLQEFLQTMATKYEMHVYTMGTRAYAEEVCAAIDPGGKIFGNRILSRDESGSLTQKSLQRLFPCDQSMVVIIDDRADVWEWSPNLVKVVHVRRSVLATFCPSIRLIRIDRRLLRRDWRHQLGVPAQAGAAGACRTATTSARHS
ncbi:HAD-like domain-containing protein [Cubamyces menziesii]|nr:HAD-like domain-containing protein [Cubamyces menziesii]